MYSTRLLLYALQRTILVSVPLLAAGFLSPVHGQLYFNRPAAKVEALNIIERRLADPTTRSRMSSDDWNLYGDRVADALADQHEGLRQGALRIVIQYGAMLNLKKSAVFDLVRIYRGHENDRVRRMAAVAVAKTEDPWAVDFLRRSIRFEKDPAVRHTLVAIAVERFGEIEVGLPQTAEK